jgi:hypothetical protein
MCEPATISAAVGYVAANAAAISAASSAAAVAAGAVAQRQMSNANASNARQAQDSANAGLTAQQQQINQQATDQMNDRSKQAFKDIGALNTIFADSGVAGASQDRISNELEGNAAADITTLERNRQAAMTQTSAQGAAIAANTQSRINSAPQPSILGTGLQIVATGTNAYDRQNPTTRQPRTG